MDKPPHFKMIIKILFKIIFTLKNDLSFLRMCCCDIDYFEFQSLPNNLRMRYIQTTMRY